MPARGGATVLRPGRNLASRSERAPCFENTPSVRRTQESGSSEILEKRRKDAEPLAGAEWVREGIRRDRGEHEVDQRREKTHGAGACKRARREQQRHGRKRQSYLLRENPAKQNYVSMMEEEFE